MLVPSYTGFSRTKKSGYEGKATAHKVYLSPGERGGGGKSGGKKAVLYLEKKSAPTRNYSCERAVIRVSLSTFPQ